MAGYTQKQIRVIAYKSTFNDSRRGRTGNPRIKVPFNSGCPCQSRRLVSPCTQDLEERAMNKGTLIAYSKHKQSNSQ